MLSSVQNRKFIIRGPFWLKRLTTLFVLLETSSCLLYLLKRWCIHLLDRRPVCCQKIHMAAAHIRPTADELLAIVDLGTLLEWAGILNDDRVVAAAEQQDGDQMIPAVAGFNGSLASLLAFYGAAPTTHFRQFASLTPADFTQFISEWQPNGGPPSWAKKAAAKLAHATARAICKMEPWTDEVQPPQPPPQLAAQPFPPVPSPAGSLLNVPTVSISEVVDQRYSETITFVNDEEWLKARAQYKREMHVDPPEHCDYTHEQLSAMLHVLKSHRGPYVDFAVFGPFGARRLKRHAMTGMLFNAGGLFHKVELYVPPSIEEWLECWNVLCALLIAVNAISRPVLKAYKAHM